MACRNEGQSVDILNTELHSKCLFYAHITYYYDSLESLKKIDKKLTKVGISLIYLSVYLFVYLSIYLSICHLSTIYYVGVFGEWVPQHICRVR